MTVNERLEQLEKRLAYLEGRISCLENQQNEDTKKLVTLVYNGKGGSPR
ncbi:hypothetical protein [Natribacillus halophilus]|uniref:Uncharacterized protein n=1 Tax=Natribacillus halophilus TaxID=549003 RepID=A0A1G8JMN3_9BACI|nr:hypothetical protein [Natribacillus halophilus]SDI32436.1 hypothetical protein SAMN04488123_101305 [Natribacillus halophilus]